ncbi:hypothetical protein SAMN04487761_1242 [Lachnospiraceae bacterium C7]|nr:hypothetical protein SAMN04487761_1242 [Lachnospiraceae bacterium C7]
MEMGVQSASDIYFLKRLINQRWEYLVIQMSEVTREEEGITHILNVVKEEEKFRKELNKKRSIKVLLDLEDNKGENGHRFFTCTMSEEEKREYQFVENDSDIPESVYKLIKDYKDAHPME